MTTEIPEGNDSLEDRILGGLDAEQREVASTLNGPLCVLAGAGTGKTRAITHRIAYGVHSGVYSPQRLLAVTFTARAAAEMRSRLRDLGVGNVQARTFHAAALRQLQFFWPQAVGGTLPNLLDHKAQMIAEAARRLRLSTDRASIRDLASEIEWAKVSMLTPANYLENAQDRGNPGGFDLTAVARVFQSYEDVKTDRNVIDFEDVLLITVGILQEDPKVAATVREQYRHFVVDEYQDVSPLQQRLLELWLGGRDELCVVGDASQTIYSFTGASPKHLLGFKAMYPDANVVKLIRDYRSTPAGGEAGQRPAGRPPQRRPGGGRRLGQRRCSSWPSGRPDRCRSSPNAPTMRQRPPLWPARSAACSTPAPQRARSPSCSAPTASPRRTNRPWPPPESATSCAAASASSPARKSATPSSSCGRPPAPSRSPQPRAAGPAGPRHRRLAGLHGLRAAQRRRPAGTLGIACCAGGPGR